ncbi:MAG: YegS/Rv2252/BmrU family lipid kinase [Methyloceanibacter sp.]|uniref:YegS/Rv2252/BmrU family lipid kinase n=1 Tax=Methyloceanibacter sp. TaxID=1965321 RepID=UPI003D9AB7FB
MLILVNPGASRAEAALRELETLLRDHRNTRVIKTSSADHLAQAIMQHGPSSARIVIGGGDGTISCALPQLLALGKPVAVLPLGTANDFAKTIGVGIDLAEAAQVAIEGVEHRIDVGVINGRPFLNVASIGLPVDVAEAQSSQLKRRLRIFSYGASLRQAVHGAQPFTIDVQIDDRPSLSGLAYQVSVGNGRFHGGGLTVSDHASIDDGLLDVYIVRPGRYWQLFAALAYMRFGLGPKPEVLERHTASRVTLRTRKPRAVNVDGEICAGTPAEFSLEREALTVVVPRTLPPGHLGLACVGRSAAKNALT